MPFQHHFIRLIHLVALAPFICVGGCAGAKSATKSEQFFETPGHYAARPLTAVKPRVGIAMPLVEVASGLSQEPKTAQTAAEQLFWVAERSDRFNLISQARLMEILASGNPGTLLSPDGELLHPVPVRGIDYLLTCKISSLSIRGDKKPDTVSVANVETLLRISHPKPRITTTCIVDLRLVDPAGATTVAQVRDSFERICSPEAMGLSFPTSDVPWGELHLDDEQAGQVLRIVLDDALRKVLPQVDAKLIQPTTPAIAIHPATTGPTTSTANAKPRPAAIRIHCKECGIEVSGDDEFCPNCGAKIIVPAMKK